MAFSRSNIYRTDQLFCGLSYSDLIPMWWNYIMTLRNNPPQQLGRLLYLLGNVEGQSHPLPNQSPIQVTKDTAVFFPILCEIVSKKDHPALDSEMERRVDLQNTLASPNILDATINGYHLSKGVLDNYYAESSDFIFDVPGTAGSLRTKFNPPIRQGSDRAVAGGYYLLLKPPNSETTYNIHFEGKNNKGYHTEATYQVNYV